MCGDQSRAEANKNPSVCEEGHAAAILAAFNLGCIYKDIELTRFEGQVHFPFEWIALRPPAPKNACVIQRGRRFLKLREKLVGVIGQNLVARMHLHVLATPQPGSPIPSIDTDAYSGRTIGRSDLGNFISPC
jgi:hypothetical protein